MFTIRHNVFETNSSSEHALKVNRDVPRKKEDFPLLNDQGILELEATRYWAVSYTHLTLPTTLIV